LRRYENERADNLRASWTTRTLASYIAAGYMTDGKSENTALENAGKLTLDPVEAVLLGSAPQETPKENAAGSYERIMARFGSGGMRPPGM